MVLSSKYLPPPVAVAKAPTVRYAVELEIMRLDFDMKKFAAEEARRKADMKTAKLREEREEACRKDERE